MTIKIVVNNENQGGGGNSNSSQVLTLESVLITIGSANAANVKLSGGGIALEQAVIINENGQSLFINQAKGTVLNGKEIEQGFPHPLKSGDNVQIGTYQLVIELENQYLKPIEMLPAENTSLATRDGFPDEPGSENFAEDSLHSGNNKLGVETFADILSSLRKEEDQFYFQLTETDGSKRRLVIESDEIVLGWDNAHNIFTTNQEATLDLPQAVIRKDWNGVTIYPNGNEAILLNSNLLEAGSRLRNGDKTIFSRLTETGTSTVTLIFCEPAALIELNAILPQELLSNALETNQSGEITAENIPSESAVVEVSQQKVLAGEKPAAKKPSPYYFRYFMLTEIIIMIIATILTAMLTYILLDFS